MRAVVERAYPSRLARVRAERDVSQADLADWTGISRSTIQRLERGAVTDPGIRMLTNIALALDVELDEILEDEWSAWTTFDPRAPQPPSEETRERSRQARAGSRGPRVR